MTTGHVRTAPTLVSSRRIAALGLLASFLALLVTPARAAAGTPERVSVDSAGNEGNGGSGGPVISADGRFVAFASYASNLVPGDTNGVADVFVHDRQTGITERVSVDSLGNEGNGSSANPSISADGRFVAFDSGASNLVAGDTNGGTDVFVHDRQTGTTERVSVDSAGNEAHVYSPPWMVGFTAYSASPAISADGRVVAFYSNASNLVPGDTNGEDAFVHDRQTGITERVSVDSAGNQANDRSGRCEMCPAGTVSISADGRFVAFWSLATNLVPGRAGGGTQVFVRDRQTGTTERMSVDGAGNPANGYSFNPTISADGRFVAFDSSATNLGDTTGVFVHDRQTGATQGVRVGSDPALSADGRVVAFSSAASDLVPGDTNGQWDVFVQGGIADPQPLRTNGQPRPSGTFRAGTTEVTLSITTYQDATCRYSTTPGVAYEAMTATFTTTGGTEHATTVGGLRDGESYSFYVRCQDTAGNANPDDYVIAFSIALPGASPGPTERVSVDSAGTQGNSSSGSPAISGDGRFVAFVSYARNLVTGDSNWQQHVYVHDRQTGTTERVSVDSAGNQGDGGSSTPSISADGRFVAFSSYATNLVPGDTNGALDVFVHDRQTGRTERVSVDSAGNQVNEGSSPAISADGRFVAFVSRAPNLVPGDTDWHADVFVHDRQTRTIERVSVDSAGTQGNSDSWGPAISADGRFVAFVSRATNLVPGDTNGFVDVFVHDRQTGATERVSMDSAGSQGDGVSAWPSISADGRFVAFNSDATNLVPGDTNGRTDVFVHDRQTGTTERVSADSAGVGGGSGAALSADGRFVAFASDAANLVPGDTNGYPDVFVRDRQTGTIERVSMDSFARQGNNHSFDRAISADGRFVAFSSYATNLVAGDTNRVVDVFVHDRRSPDAP